MHTLQDFKAIGIDKKGFQLKLEKEAKKLQSTKFKIDVPVSIMLNKNTWGIKSARSIRSNIVNKGQVTKLIILVKICYKLLYVIQGVENSFGKVIT